MSNKYEDQIKAEWEKFENNKDKHLPNIMLLGATGCGKSSLINLVFGKEIAPVNDVTRGTNGFKTYEGAKYGIGVNLIDSRGYEMVNGKDESFKSYRTSIKTEMERSREADAFGKIHIIWYCLSVAGEKVQPYDIEILKLLRTDSELRGRVAIVLTKCDEDDEDGNGAKIFRETISKELGSTISSFEVSTDPEIPLDIEELMNWSVEQLDDNDMKDAFIASQTKSLKSKRETAAKHIAGYSTTAAGIGAAPLPFADSAALIPLQIVMSTDIIHIYGIDNLAHISKAVLSDVVISNLGKSLASGLLKLIPGVNAVATVINAGVASLITSALGFAISEICYRTCQSILRGEHVDFSSIFNSEDIKGLTSTYISTHKTGKNK